MKRLMKHVQVLSSQKPAKAEETAWIQLKDIIGNNYTAPALGGFVGPVASNMSGEQSGWLAAQFDNWLQK